MTFATFQLRRDTTANWASVNPVLASGEQGLDTTTGQIRIGDGTTPWLGLPILSGDKTYVHTQGSSASVWTVTHNLGKYPAVTVLDSGGSEFEAEITHTDVNSLTITLAVAVTGTATCN